MEPKIPIGGTKLGRGYIEATSMDDFTFESEYQNFQKSGYALDAFSNTVIGDYNSFLSEKSSKAINSSINKKRKIHGVDISLLDDEDDEGAGPWAPIKQPKANLPSSVTQISVPVSSKSVALNATNPIADIELESHSPSGRPNEYIIEPELEDEKWEKKNERKLGFILPPRPARGSHSIDARTTFHGESLKDFQGRSWAAPPQGVRPEAPGEHDCFLPKKCVRKLSGHSKGVQTVAFFPGTGHLLLSASMDGKCKVWDAQESFQVMRTYIGHSEGIRSTHLNNDGSQFLSSGYDRYIRLWDTETGQAVATFTNRKMGYCVKFYPRDNNLFLAASHDNRIYQWDARSGQIVQQYNHHLQACNAVEFYDDGRKFMSTSDDKKVLVWEFDIPVPIKYISDPEQHSVPAMAHHPTEEFIAGQSMDNKIILFSAGENLKPYKKKVFTGHNNSGYACQVGFSPSGRHIISGDGLGFLHIWDWKTTKSFRRFHAHDNGPCMGAVWHPLHPSRVASCGWDGFIKIWE